MKFKGKAQRVIFERDDFKLILFRSTDSSLLPPEVHSKDVVVKGYGISFAKDMEYVLQGEWRHDPKRGTQFYTDGVYEMLTPKSTRALEKYLASDEFRGIGPRTAKRIVKAFGEDTLSVIQSNPERLHEVRGLSDKKIDAIVEAVRRNHAYQELALFLTGQCGVPAATTKKVFKFYTEKGQNAKDEICKNPYGMLKIKGVGFKTCDDVAIVLHVKLDSYVRVRGCVLNTLTNMCQRGGDMFEDFGTLRNECLRTLNAGRAAGSVSPDCFNQRFREIMEHKHVVVRGRCWVFPHDYEVAEHAVAAGLVEMLKSPAHVKPAKIKSAIDAYVANSSIKLSDKQQQAVLKSLSNRVSVITGGPGTGKTTIIRCIINVFKKTCNLPVVCMAPTGKAARRMTEATGEDAHTIHKQLGLYGDEDSAPVPLPKALVIIDEMSMVDALLMAKVMEAIDKHGAYLIMVGDINQLPSVGVGAVLGDVINSGVIPVSRLTEIFRQKGGSTIIDDAYKINNGEHDLIYDDKFQFIPADGEDAAIQAVKDVYMKGVEAYGIENVALLSPLRRTQNGRFKCVTEALNPVLQDLANPMTTTKPNFTFGGHEYRLHDRVMQWQNTETSANGDIGEVINIGSDDEDLMYVEIKWDNGNVVKAYKDDLESIDLAYSMSIHKSQGSEYKLVIIPMLSVQNCPLFKRNLLYTGVTRAKEKCVLIGDKREIDRTIALSDSNVRRTMLAKRLQYNCEKEN